MSDKISTKIYESIKFDIVTREIDERTFLNEGELAKKYQVSKAPVREALHLLCDQGYLVSYPRKGYMVNIFTVEEINHIQRIRVQLEKLCAKLAIENATTEEIKTLRDYTKEESNALEPDKTNNARFHMRLAEISHNPFLPDVLRDLVNKASLSHIKTESDFNSHNEIIDALLDRNWEDASKCIEKDIYEI